MQRVLVVVVTYNAMKWAKECFGCLENSLEPVDVFVIDNGSTDGTQNYIREKYPRFIFTQCSENLGFGKGNNVGFRYALDHDYEYVYLLNQDAWIFPQTIPVLIETFKNNPEYGLLSPLQKTRNLLHLDKNFLACCPSGMLSDYLCSNSKNLYEADHFMAAHWFIKIKALKDVGLFSPTFKHYGEDDNWISRLKFHGYKCGIVTNADAVHDREFREDSNEKKLWLRYSAALCLLSNPYQNTIRQLFSQSVHLFVMGCKFHSVQGLVYIFKLMSHFRNIRFNKQLSLNKGAFINKD